MLKKLRLKFIALNMVTVAAVNEAIKRVEDTASSEMEAITGSMNLPGMGGFPGLF
jgi:DNA-binding protein YbaB